MSCDIRRYKSLDLGGGANEMDLTAFFGGEDGHCIQFTINGEYCALDQNALLDLIETIVKRIRCVDGYNATGKERYNIKFKQ